MNNRNIKDSFLEKLDFSQIGMLFEHLPGIYFFAKNLEGRFVLGNTATCKTFGFKKNSDLIGKSDYDVASTEIANQYRDADQQVIRSKQAIMNIIEPLPDTNGVLKWYSTNKIPLFDKGQNVLGVAVIMRDVSSIGSLLGPYEAISDILEHIFKNYSQQIFVKELAALSDISVKQLERRFKKLFGQTPLRYINEHRIKISCMKLRESNIAISAIAQQVGFYDHAHFIRNFKNTMNMTPRQYRSQFN
jgi:PAS domain S-box-containing protein